MTSPPGDPQIPPPTQYFRSVPTTPHHHQESMVSSLAGLSMLPPVTQDGPGPPIGLIPPTDRESGTHLRPIKLTIPATYTSYRSEPSLTSYQQSRFTPLPDMQCPPRNRPSLPPRMPNLQCSPRTSPTPLETSIPRYFFPPVQPQNCHDYCRLCTCHWPSLSNTW